MPGFCTRALAAKDVLWHLARDYPVLGEAPRAVVEAIGYAALERAASAVRCRCGGEGLMIAYLSQH